MKKILVMIIILMHQLVIGEYGEVEIKVAVYFSNVKRFAEEVMDAIDYSWKVNHRTYSINPEIITKEDVINGKLDEYDVFVIPGSGRPYFDAYNLKWRRAVINFVEEGGGYVGICGGANLASMGFNEGLSPNSLLSASVLKIADVYVNDEQDEEWQYLWKSNWRHGGPPIKIYIPENDIPIFEGFYDTYRSIRYWGGPGMYKMGDSDAIPLAIYAEEPMEVCPLHYWKYERGEWIPYRNITTDIMGEYAVVADFYGRGRIVLFGPHPERKTFFDGYVEEFPVNPELSPFTWFIYNWVSDNESEVSYNWWILRRSVAWTAKIENMPYSSEIAIIMEEPEGGIYIDGRKIMYSGNIVVIGKINIMARAIEAEKSMLYIDGKFVCEGNETLFHEINLPGGKHEIRLVAKNDIEEARCHRIIYVMNATIKN